MDYMNQKTKNEANILIIRKDVKLLLQSFEERGATVEDLNIAINMLQTAAGKLGCSAPVKANCMDEIGDAPFRFMLDILRSKS